jgi:hypothetical protein
LGVDAEQVVGAGMAFAVGSPIVSELSFVADVFAKNKSCSAPPLPSTACPLKNSVLAVPVRPRLMPRILGGHELRKPTAKGTHPCRLSGVYRDQEVVSPRVDIEIKSL